MLIIRAKRSLRVPNDPERVSGSKRFVARGNLALVHDALVLPEGYFEVVKKVEIASAVLKDGKQLKSKITAKVNRLKLTAFEAHEKIKKIKGLKGKAKSDAKESRLQSDLDALQKELKSQEQKIKDVLDYAKSVGIAIDDKDIVKPKSKPETEVVAGPAASAKDEEVPTAQVKDPRDEGKGDDSLGADLKDAEANQEPTVVTQGESEVSKSKESKESSPKPESDNNKHKNKSKKKSKKKKGKK